MGRVFVRGIESDVYSLEEIRRARLSAPRVRSDDEIVDDGSVGHSVRSSTASSLWRLGPGDEDFLTQTVQVHDVRIQPGGANRGHGHQNEAAFYVVSGHGYEIHDGERYDWGPGDLVMVHVDSVHQHYNSSETESVHMLVMKTKSMWMFMGLLQQGATDGFAGEGFGPRQDWSPLWSPDASARRKVVRGSELPWDETPDGSVKVLCGPDDDVRAFGIDVYEQRIAAAASSPKHWHMADEVLYVLSGSGYSLHWEVAADIDDRYYARIANEPTRHDFGPGDILYVPPNHVHQHVAAAPGPLHLLSAQNRVFKHLGYDNVVHREP